MKVQVKLQESEERMKKEGEKHKSVVAGLQGQVQEIQRQLEQAKQVSEREREGRER